MLYTKAMPAGFIGETDKNTVFLRHTIDSILPVFYHPHVFLPHPSKILDLGAGAGLPSIPLAICLPNTQIVSIDSQQKRLVFCEEIKQALGLDNYATIHSTVEKLSISPEPSPPLLVFRAFRKILAALELSLSVACVGTKVLYYRSKKINFTPAGLARIKDLGFHICEFQQYNAPQELGERGGYIFQSITTPANGYPRKWKKIQADELVQRES